MLRAGRCTIRLAASAHVDTSRRSPDLNVAVLVVDSRPAARAMRAAFEARSQLWRAGISASVWRARNAGPHAGAVSPEVRANEWSTGVVTLALPAPHEVASAEDFTRLMLEPAPLWSKLVAARASHVLVVQNDVVIMRTAGRDEWLGWLRYGFVGAPWDARHNAAAAIAPIGNGGCSLRSVAASLRVALAWQTDVGGARARVRAAWAAAHAGETVAAPEPVPEDVVVAALLPPGATAPPEEAARFAHEGLPGEGDGGYPGPWAAHGKNAALHARARGLAW